MEFGVRPYLLPSKVETYLRSSKHVSYSLEELLVISVVRNGELYIRSFLDHYRAMGVRHFVFLDNESTDRTVEMLCAHEDVTWTANECPLPEIREHDEEVFGRRFSPGRWNLCADIDELFDYPFSESLRLAAFLQYLTQTDTLRSWRRCSTCSRTSRSTNWRARPTTFLRKRTSLTISPISKERTTFGRNVEPCYQDALGRNTETGIWHDQWTDEITTCSDGWKS